MPKSAQGVKFDADKPQWDLMPWAELEEVAKVLTFGAKKYSPNNWQTVPNARRRYYAAALRHLVAWTCHEQKDPESGQHHLAHAMCCLLFIMWIDKNLLKYLQKSGAASPVKR